ncbi:pentapeptide repeat-containing protein [Lentzea albidocapillata]|uniref:Pentapeptide repeat-containing protein n=1 Tax=Lentzea albidocapillata TaxID=40571 RepID=A0A1W2FDS7_9PSEU|nr:pentapeptide repeat-containing protein [Lentzea albidocapillata]SMD19964.1 hypothetical protein SAMN05660733_05757 [Lentzea albidocapillata]
MTQIRPLQRSPGLRIAASAAAHRAAPTRPQTTTGDEQRRQEREVRLTAQRLLSRHLRLDDSPKHSVDTFWPDIDLDLTGATLIDLNLTGCLINTARFDGASFTGHVMFDKVSFAGHAEFDKATFRIPPQADGARFEEGVPPELQDAGTGGDEAGAT